MDCRPAARARSPARAGRTEPLALLQPEHAPARRGARPLRGRARTLPELRRAAGWEQLGRSVLIEQIGRQIAGRRRACGALDALPPLHARLLSAGARRRATDSRPAGARLRRSSRAPGAVRAHDERRQRALAGHRRRRWRQPVSASADDTRPTCSDSLQLAAQLLDRPALAIGPAAEEVIWMTGAAPPASRTARRRGRRRRCPPRVTSCRDPTRGDHLTIDAGHHGFLNGGHAHADALAVTLTRQRAAVPDRSGHRAATPSTRRSAIASARPDITTR